MRVLVLGILVATAASAMALQTAAPPAAHFHHVHVNSTDPAKTQQFYESTFGAQPVKFKDKTDALFVSRGFILINKVAQAPKDMARDLSARSEQIMEFDRTRRLLLADISHELMTPLTAIRVCHEKLSTDPAIRGALQRRQYVAIIGEETLRVERIVRDLLDLAKFENNSDALDLLDVSIEGLFGRVTARQQADAAKRGVTLTASIETGAEIVRGDPFRLEQALQNLAANALRHVPTGGSVDLYAKIAGGEIIITVRDTGAGVEAEHLPFIFNRFYKVDSSRVAGPEGSGLGLSIVKAIVERHGGTVAVASQPHVETVFTIRLPASTDVGAIKQSA